MKTLLVTGVSGLLGLNLSLRFGEKYRIIGIGNQMRLQNIPFEMQQRDFLLPDAAERLLDETQPDAVIHCAALANLEACEKEPEGAMRLNGEFPGELARAAASKNVPLIHISTDAVFDGQQKKDGGYTEEDQPNPINVYAVTKLAGERNVLDANPNALVARVNFYGWSLSGRRSLCEFFYNNLAAGKSSNGFTDVFFCPLYVNDLAEILEKLLSRKTSGLLHVFGSDVLTKFEFGQAIATQFGFDPTLVQPVSWQEGGLSAARSPYLIMNTARLRGILGEELPGKVSGLSHLYQDRRAGLPEKLKSFRVD